MAAKADRQQRDKRLIEPVGIDLAELKNARELVTDALSGLPGRSRPERRAAAAGRLDLDVRVFNQIESYLHGRLSEGLDEDAVLALRRLAKTPRSNPALTPSAVAPVNRSAARAKPAKPTPSVSGSRAPARKAQAKPVRRAAAKRKTATKPIGTPAIRLSVLAEGRHRITGKLVGEQTSWVLRANDGRNYPVTDVEEQYPGAHVNKTKTWILQVREGKVKATTQRNDGKSGSVATFSGGLPGLGKSRRL